MFSAVRGGWCFVFPFAFVCFFRFLCFGGLEPLNSEWNRHFLCRGPSAYTRVGTTMQYCSAYGTKSKSAPIVSCWYSVYSLNSPCPRIPQYINTWYDWYAILVRSVVCLVMGSNLRMFVYMYEAWMFFFLRWHQKLSRTHIIALVGTAVRRESTRRVIAAIFSR